jgi:SagB-type dehydrogenase family enzyme
MNNQINIFNLKINSMKIISLFFVTIFMSLIAMCQDLQPIKLLPPQLDKGKNLMQSLSDRQSNREFADKKLSQQDLSNLLWAANGVNRVKEQKHTAPTAMNHQEVDIYVFLEEGVYLYDPHEMVLNPVVKGDYRATAGTQDFVKTAPVNLVYVSDYARMGSGTDEGKATYAPADAAFIGQNVYLFCSAFSFNCVFRGSVNKEAVAKLLNLRPGQHVQFAQTVGFPK